MKKYALGLYLSETTAQAVVIERSNSRPMLIAFREWENTLFDYAGDDTPGMDEFVDHLSRFLEATAVVVPHAGVALDASLLFFNTIPFEGTSTQEQIEQQIAWELSEYFPGLPKHSFISDTHILARRGGTRFDNVLVVSVRRNLVHQLRHGLGKLQLRLTVVDSDHFSADSMLRANYPETATKFFILAGVKPHRLDVSFIRSNEVESYEYYSIPSRHAMVERIAAIAGATRSLHSITLYGAEVTPELLADIRKTSATPVEELNPFRSVGVAEAVRGENNPTSTPFRFAAAIGVALREG